MELALDLVRWALLLFGLVYVVTDAMITSPLRVALAKGSALRAMFLYCPACVGFWVGAALGLGGAWPFLPSGATSDWLLLQAAVESAIAAMAMGAAWGRLFGGSAWDVERDEVFPGLEGANDEAKEGQDGQG